MKFAKDRPLGTLPCEVYAFSGKMGTGKNHVAELIFLKQLQEMHYRPTMVVAFADFLKINTCIEWRIPYKMVFAGSKTYEIRQLLQKTGTEERRKFGANIYVRYLELWCRLLRDRGIERFIITDARLPNEVQWVKGFRYHKVIRIEAPNRNRHRIKEEAMTQFRLQYEQEPSCWQRLVNWFTGNSDTPIFSEVSRKIEAHPTETGLDVVPPGTFDYILQNDFQDADTIGLEVAKIVHAIAHDPSR